MSAFQTVFTQRDLLFVLCFIAVRMSTDSRCPEKLGFPFCLRNIPKLHVLSPSDPFISVSLKDEVKDPVPSCGQD